METLACNEIKKGNAGIRCAQGFPAPPEVPKNPNKNWSKIWICHKNFVWDPPTHQVPKIQTLLTQDPKMDLVN